MESFLLLIINNLKMVDTCYICVIKCFNNILKNLNNGKRDSPMNRRLKTALCRTNMASLPYPSFSSDAVPVCCWGVSDLGVSLFLLGRRPGVLLGRQ